MLKYLDILSKQAVATCNLQIFYFSFTYNVNIVLLETCSPLNLNGRVEYNRIAFDGRYTVGTFAYTITCDPGFIRTGEFIRPYCDVSGTWKPFVECIGENLVYYDTPRVTHNIVFKSTSHTSHFMQMGEIIVNSNGYLMVSCKKHG